MGLQKFELKQEHLIMIKHLNWELTEDNRLTTSIEEGAENIFGGINIVEDVGMMIYGKPDEEFDPLSPYSVQYTEEQREHIFELLSELPIALELTNYLLTYELGTYVRKWNLKNWKKI